MSEIDSNIIKNTQTSLGEYFKKPPLTEKLLSRPPFRFLHDIVTSVIGSTGFMKGLFTDQEMNSENVKEKGAKIDFLKKLIGIVSLVLNTPINVNPASIVAGKEPENTNLLLQSLAKSISKKVDNNFYVKKTLAGDADKLISSKVVSVSTENKSNDKQKFEIEKTKKTEKTKHRINSETTDNIKAENKKSMESKKHKERQLIEEKPKEKKAIEDKSKEKKAIDDKLKEKHIVEDKSNKKKEKDKIENESVNEKQKKDEIRINKHKAKEINNVDNKIDSSNNGHGENLDSNLELAINENVLGDNDIDSTKRLARPSSAKGTRHRHENEHPVLSDEKENEKKKSIIRPPSARPAPPKVRKSSEAGLDDAIHNQTKVSGLIIDIDRDSDDGDYVVEEFIGGGDIDVKFSHTNVNPSLIEGEQHGSLVQSIIQSKKEFINNEKVGNVNHSDIHKIRERLTTEKEIEKLRQNLQALTKSVNPLGKLIDFIQEDLDTMQKESERWHNENEELEKSLQSEQNVTNTLLKPIKEKLQEQNKIIADQEEAISKLKSNIEKNSRKIETILLNSCSNRL